MKRIAILAAALAAAAPAGAQDPDIPPAPVPRLKAEAVSVRGFVPPGWGLEAERTGDLNGDGRIDAVFVLRGEDPKLVIANDSLGEPLFNTNPRILAVAFARPSGGYALAMQDSSLIPRREIPTQSDPFEAEYGLKIERGAFHVRLEHFMSAGGWGMFNVTYIFRWQNNRFELIGWDRNDTTRNTGEMRTASVNFSTGRVKITTGNIESDDEKVEWRTLRDRRPIAIEAIGDGLDWEPPL